MLISLAAAAWFSSLSFSEAFKCSLWHLLPGSVTTKGTLIGFGIQRPIENTFCWRQANGWTRFLSIQLLYKVHFLVFFQSNFLFFLSFCAHALWFWNIKAVSSCSPGLSRTLRSPIQLTVLLTKDSYVHVDVSDGSFAELGDILLAKRQEQGLEFWHVRSSAWTQ